jgi:hypothetical protein
VIASNGELEGVEALRSPVPKIDSRDAFKMKTHPRLRKAIHRSFSLTSSEVDYILKDIKQGMGDKPSSELLVHIKRSPKQIVEESFKFRNLND